METGRPCRGGCGAATSDRYREDKTLSQLARLTLPCRRLSKCSGAAQRWGSDPQLCSLEPLLLAVQVRLEQTVQRTAPSAPVSCPLGVSGRVRPALTRSRPAFSVCRPECGLPLQEGSGDTTEYRSQA